jgi:DNA gyrase subunit B
MQVRGQDLKAWTQKVGRFARLLEKLKSSVGSLALLESVAFMPDLDLEKAAEAPTTVADAICVHLGATMQGTWEASYDEALARLTLARMQRGIREEYGLDVALFTKADMRQLRALAEELKEVFTGEVVWTTRKGDEPLRGSYAFWKRMLQAGRSGYHVQRYKGLGEMEVEELWTTTMDPDARQLLQVKIGHVDEANDTFSLLMGDIVSPRRAFIQENALKVAQIDA